MVDRSKKFLVVEGEEDLYAIVALLGHYVTWPKKKSEAPVTIVARGGVDNVLDADTIPLRLKSREVEILGIVIDANDEFGARWDRVRQLCEPAFPTLPKDLPADGLVISNSEPKKLGVWIMPDNANRGMLETFMSFLVPGTDTKVWDCAQAAVKSARAAGAKFLDVHRDKAHISTWLAWQDPPGNSMGTALIRNCLDARAPYAAPFVSWFKQLYEI